MSILDNLPEMEIPEKCSRCGATEFSNWRVTSDGWVSCDKCPDAHDFGSPIYTDENKCLKCGFTAKQINEMDFRVCDK